MSISKRIEAARDKNTEDDNPLKGLTRAQVEAYIDANVVNNNAATLRAALKIIARLLVHAFRRIEALEELAETLRQERE